MKRAGASAFARVFLFAALALPLSAGAGGGRPVRARLTQLFKLCRAGDVETAAGYFVYRGPDKAREWKDTYRAADAAERAIVQDGCARIKSYLNESEGFAFGPVKVERESEGAWHVVAVTFKRGAETRRVVFAFLPVRGQFSVGDID